MELDQVLMENGEWHVSDTFVGKKGSWYRTRHVHRVVGAEIETSTVLEVLAKARFPEGWDPERQKPYWIDKNWENETVENVGLVTLSGVQESVGRPAVLGIQAPSGSKEYQKQYREMNREKYRLANKKYQEKVRAAYKAARKKGEPAVGSHEPAPAADSYTSEMQTRLERILAGTGGTLDSASLVEQEKK